MMKTDQDVLASPRAATEVVRRPRRRSRVVAAVLAAAAAVAVGVGTAAIVNDDSDAGTRSEPQIPLVTDGVPDGYGGGSVDG
jgi:hypothetical protein